MRSPLSDRIAYAHEHTFLNTMAEEKKKQSTDLMYRAARPGRNAKFPGGPGTWMPSALESILGWSLALGSLMVSGYHYIMGTVIKPTVTSYRDSGVLLLHLLHIWHPKISHDSSNGIPRLLCWLPLTTYSKMEVDQKTASQRQEQLRNLLRRLLGPDDAWTDDGIVQVLRNVLSARRLATLALLPRPSSLEGDVTSTLLGQQLARVWHQVLALPSPDTMEFHYDISLILPAFRENGSELVRKLDKALESAHTARTVEVIVVDAGECTDLNLLLPLRRGGWGALHIFEFAGGGGRGPCMNFGAANAKGAIYTFCHSDTSLPHHWDARVKEALDTTIPEYRPNSCAFKFGIDTSPEGLGEGPYPPGVKGVEMSVNIRSQLYSLPYGDQVLSVPAAVFHYLGGYPDQCIMEDYELVSLLRLRAALLPSFRNAALNEKLVVVGGEPSLCSPRRWQRFGVPYVTWHNFKFVNLYESGLKPDELYQLYYGRPAPTRKHAVAPWELALIEENCNQQKSMKVL